MIEQNLEAELAEARAQIAALAKRHEKALVEGAARLAERDEARREITFLKARLAGWEAGETEARAQIAAKDAEIERLRSFGRTAMAELAAKDAYINNNDFIGGWRTRAEKAEAQIAAKDAALTKPCDCGDDLTECFRHHITTTVGWPAFGARPGTEMQMYEEGFKAGYRRCKSDNEPELGESEALDEARAQIAAKDAALRFVGFTDEEIAALAAPARETK